MSLITKLKTIAVLFGYMRQMNQRLHDLEENVRDLQRLSMEKPVKGLRKPKGAK